MLLLFSIRAAEEAVYSVYSACLSKTFFMYKGSNCISS